MEQGYRETEMTSEKTLSKTLGMFPQVKPKQKAVDGISSAQVTKSFRRRVNSFSFCNSESIKNEERLGKMMAPSLSQHPPLELSMSAQHVVLIPPVPCRGSSVAKYP